MFNTLLQRVSSTLSAGRSRPEGAVRARRPSLRLEALEAREVMAATIYTIAGTGPAGFTGDRGPATKAMLDQPSGLTVDSRGNVFFIDDYNERVRKISPTGTITTLAGNGIVGDWGDGGKATGASFQFGSGAGVATDSKGNVYIACPTKHRVRMVTPDGIIHHFAGGEHWQNHYGDGGRAKDAYFDSPYAVVVDTKGNVFIADSGLSMIRKVSPTGIITTVAGIGGYDKAGYSGDGGPATKARINHPSDIAVDAKGNLFILDSGNSRVRKVSPAGIITTIAGNGVKGFRGDGGKATLARLNFAGQGGVTVDGRGNIFIADTGNHRIREVLPSGIIRTFAGTGVAGF